MKKVFISLVLSLFVMLSFAQTVEVNWGQEYPLNKGKVVKIVGDNAESLYVVKQLENGQYWLDVFSLAMNNLENSYELLMPSVSGNPTEYKEMFYIDGQLILFTTGIDNQTNKKAMYVQYINADGTVSNKPKVVGLMSTSNGNVDFELSLSEDKSKIFLHYYKLFSTYAGEPFTFKVIDSNLMEVFSTDVIMTDFNERKFSITQYALTNSGNIYMAARAEKKTKKKSAKLPIYESLILTYNSQKEELRSYPVVVQKYLVGDIAFGIDANENILIMGFTMKKNRPDILGVFSAKLNPHTYKFRKVTDYKKQTLLFPTTDKMVFKQERMGPSLQTAFKYTPKKLVFLKNGSTVFISEHNYIETVIVGEGTKSEEIHYRYACNDFIVAQADKNGVMQWTKRIAKNQQSRDNGGDFLSVYIKVTANQIKLFFNDNPSNISNTSETGKDIKLLKSVSKGEAVVCTLYKDGSINKEPLFGAKSKTILNPKLIYENSDGFVIYGKHKKNFKIGTFIFE